MEIAFIVVIRLITTDCGRLGDRPNCWQNEGYFLRCTSLDRRTFASTEHWFRTSLATVNVNKNFFNTISLWENKLVWPVARLLIFGIAKFANECRWSGRRTCTNRQDLIRIESFLCKLYTMNFTVESPTSFAVSSGRSVRSSKAQKLSFRSHSTGLPRMWCHY